MRALWPQIESWLEAGMPFALATVVSTDGSSPREVGSVMAIDPEGPRFIGSVSSGCLETELVEAAREVIAQKRVQYFHFGPEGEALWSDGLTCGGRVRVRLEPWWGLLLAGAYAPVVSALHRWIKHDRSGLIITRENEHIAVTESDVIGRTSNWSEAILNQATEHLFHRRVACELQIEDQSVFFRPVYARSRLFIIGAAEVTLKLVELAHIAGWKTIVVDPRSAYTQHERFVQLPDELINSWPDKEVGRFDLGPQDAALALAHDPKIDDPALVALARSRVGYIGAMGSRQSHERRVERLREQGLSNELIELVQGPCGIHLGSGTALGIATGIFAGLLQWQASKEEV
jgi:xanthine dehydrogenase accessory factor